MYETVNTKEQLKAWIGRIEYLGEFAMDTETTSLDHLTCELVGISLTVYDDGFLDSCYIPLAHRHTSPHQLDMDWVLDTLAPLTRDERIEVIFQNAVYDMVLLMRYGLEFNNVHDTMLMDYVLTVGKERARNMDIMAERYLGFKTTKFNEVVLNNKYIQMTNFRDVRIDHATWYAAEDTDITFDLYLTLFEKLAKNKDLRRVYEEIDRPLLIPLSEMKLDGVGVSKKAVRKLDKQFTTELAELDAQLEALAPGLEHTSNNKLADYLFGKLKLVPVKTSKKTGKPSVDAESLEALAEQSDVVSLILERRKLAKTQSTYTGPLLQRADRKTSRVHTQFNIAFTNTGRFSSSEPNLQNIPSRGKMGKRLRSVFVAPKNRMFVGADYSNIEMRIVAHLSQDPALVAAFRNNYDAHDATAEKVFGVTKDEVTEQEWGDLRNSAKSVNFGLIYGITEFGLSSQLGIDPASALELIDRYFEGLPGVKDYIDRQRQATAKTGMVDTLFGRRLRVGKEYGWERRAVNYVVQGTAAELNRLAISKTHAALKGFDAQILLTIHDELLIECSEKDAEDVNTITETAMSTAGDEFVDWSVPITVDGSKGHTWGEVH